MLAYSAGVDELPQVVLAARRGDRGAFAELYRRFHRAVHGVVLARVTYGDAADVVQDVFAIALERLPQLGDAAAFPGWLLAIARNRAVDHVRAKRPSPALAELTDFVEEVYFSARVAGESVIPQTSDRVDRALRERVRV